MDEEEEKEMSAIAAHRCEICQKKFQCSSNLYRHLRLSHKLQNISFSPNNHIICALCKKESVSEKQYETHLISEHEINIFKEKLCFTSEEEFFKWKKKIENETLSEFVKRCGSRTTNDIKRDYYYCHRGGYYSRRGKELRKIKAIGTNKINASCPAKIKVHYVKENIINIDFFKTHVGHTSEAARMKLPDEARQIIVEKLMNNVPTKTILAEIKNSPGNKFGRLHHITRKDVSNIRKELGIIECVSDDIPNCETLYPELPQELPMTSVQTIFLSEDQVIFSTAEDIDCVSNVIELHTGQEKEIDHDCSPVNTAYETILDDIRNIVSNEQDVLSSENVTISESENVASQKTIPQCKVCKKTYKSNTNLYRHMRTAHLEEIDMVKATVSLICPICRNQFGSKKQYLNHVQSSHQIEITPGTYMFTSEKEFTDWKKKIEKETSTLFAKSCGTRQKGQFRIDYFYCHRSGKFMTRGKQQRKLKKLGTNKIDAFCPAMMKVVYWNDNVTVEYTETHLGHTFDVARTKLTEEERNLICEKLRNQMSIQEILHDIKSNTNNKRLLLLCRRDILNIQQKLKEAYS